MSSAGRVERNAGALVLAALAPCRQSNLVEEELLEGKAAPSGFRVLGAPGKMGSGEGIRRTRQAVLGAHLLRKRLDRVASHARAAPDPLAHPVGAEAIRDRVDGNEPDGVEPVLAHTLSPDHFVRRDPEARAVELAREQKLRAGTEALDEPRLVEPHRLRRAGRVCDIGLDDAQVPPPGRAHAGLPHFDGHGGLLADAKLADLEHVGAVAIPVRQVPEQVPDRLQADVRGARGELRSGSLQARDRGFEA